MLVRMAVANPTRKTRISDRENALLHGLRHALNAGPVFFGTDAGATDHFRPILLIHKRRIQMNTLDVVLALESQLSSAQLS